ncbi:MAG: DUF3119 family protein [Cyanobacteria bacterium P01_D01_bin.14]
MSTPVDSTNATNNVTGNVTSHATKTNAVVTVLTPSFRLPLGLGAIALPVFFLQPWVGGVLALLALFLAVQTTRIRLAFTATALEVRQGQTLLRQFPYADWRIWTIFWPPLPILFYFREVNSIHFLPVLFNPGELRSQLEQHCSPQSSAASRQPTDAA